MEKSSCFVFLFFFPSLPSENRMRLTADMSKTAHATLFKAALVAGLQPNPVICGCTFSFSGDGISEGILGICIQWCGITGGKGDAWKRKEERKEIRAQES